jgi:hypothetical protein
MSNRTRSLAPARRPKARRSRAAAVTEPLEHRRLLSVNLSTNFAVLRFSDTAGFVPPDPIVAAGPNHLVEAVNANFAIFTKTGTRLSNTTFRSLFSSLSPGPILSDPQVSYDELSGRFILAIADINPTSRCQTRRTRPRASARSTRSTRRSRARFSRRTPARRSSRTSRAWVGTRTRSRRCWRECAASSWDAPLRGMGASPVRACTHALAAQPRKSPLR